MRHIPSSALSSALLRADELHNLLASYNGLQNSCEQIRDKQKDCTRPSELLVFVFGEGNFGKSSLINCLVGRDIAEVSFLPETWRVDMYRNVEPQEEEFALIRKAGSVDLATLSIEDAKAECKSQSAEAKKSSKKTEDVITPPGQIIEVQWHYRDLNLPHNIVLVDTPGFAQFRAGLNEAHTEMLSSQKGVACTIQEVYRNFVHRANVILWAFKASKLQDRDTKETFENVTRLTKHTIGVITYTDTIPLEQRPELVQKAQDLFGRGASQFIPVVSGGKVVPGTKSEKGLGIPELRQCLASLNDKAADIKVQELETFLKVHTEDGMKNLSVLGDTLIHNVSRLSLFCNAVSDVLLREARKQHQTMLQRRDQIITRSDALNPHIADGLKQIMSDMRWAVFDRHLKQQAAVEKFRNGVNDFFQVDGLNTARHDCITRISNYVTAQAKSIAHDYTMKQAIIMVGGTPEERELKAWITPPNVAGIGVSVPDFTVPVPSNHFFDALLTMIFGGEPSEEQIQTTQLAAHKAVGVLKDELPAFVPNYTRAVAEAILQSVDAAVTNLYPGENLDTLRMVADRFDRDLKRLSEIISTTATTSANQYRYGTRYRIWSPRDDTRRAAIDLFCQWFEPRQAELQEKADKWFEPSHIQSLLSGPVRQQCRDYLQSTNSHVVFVEHENERSETDRVSLLTITNFDGVVTWTKLIMDSLQDKRLFDDSVLEADLLDEFEYIRLSGIAGDFTAKVIKECLSRCQNEICNPSFEIKKYVLADERATRLRARPLVLDRSLLLASIAGTTVTVPVGSAIYFNHLYFNYLYFSLHMSPIVQAVLAGTAGAALLAPTVFGVNKALLHRREQRQILKIVNQWEAFKENRRQQCIEKQTQTLHCSVADHVSRIIHTAWLDAVPSLNADLAQTLAANRTLIQKKPLDYALEGNLDYNSHAITA